MQTLRTTVVRCSLYASAIHNTSCLLVLIHLINLAIQFVPDTYPAGQGEPLNIIISAKSDSAVLVDSTNDGGLQNYFLFVSTFVSRAIMAIQQQLIRP